MKDVNSTLILTVVGAIVVIITAIVQWREQVKTEKEKKEYQDATLSAQEKAREANETIISLQRSNLENADRLLSQTTEIAELAKQNASLQEELKNRVTGAGSKLKLRLYTSPNSEYIKGLQLVDFSLIVEGKYPLTQIQVKISDPWGVYVSPYVSRIVDVASVGLQFHNPPRQELAQNWKTLNEFNLGTIQPEQIKNFYSTSFAPFSNGREIINYAVYSVDIDGPFGYLRYSLRIEFGKGIPILRDAEIMLNYQKAKTEDYLVFNDYANMDVFIKQNEEANKLQ